MRGGHLLDRRFDSNFRVNVESPLSGLVRVVHVQVGAAEVCHHLAVGDLSHPNLESMATHPWQVA